MRRSINISLAACTDLCYLEVWIIEIVRSNPAIMIVIDCQICCGSLPYCLPCRFHLFVKITGHVDVHLLRLPLGVLGLLFRGCLVYNLSRLGIAECSVALARKLVRCGFTSLLPGAPLCPLHEQVTSQFTERPPHRDFVSSLAKESPEMCWPSVVSLFRGIAMNFTLFWPRMARFRSCKDLHPRKYQVGSVVYSTTFP